MVNRKKREAMSNSYILLSESRMTLQGFVHDPCRHVNIDVSEHFVKNVYVCTGHLVSANHVEIKIFKAESFL